MKLKNLLALTAMAAMAFTACNKDENVAKEEIGAGDNTPKSVTLSLKNIATGTRSAADPVADDSPVVVKNLQVLFVKNSGNLETGKTPDNQAAIHYFDFEQNAFDSDDFKNLQFHFLPSDVTKVIVVGNMGSKIEATNIESLKKELQIEEEQDAGNLSLYVESNLDKISGTDDAGHPMYVVTVKLEPRVSRIEVVNFTYEGDTREYESIEVKQIVLNNYYMKALFADGAVVTEGNDFKSYTAIDGTTAPKFFADAAGWSSDKLGVDPLPAIVLDAENEHTMKFDGQRPAYHFFPNAADIDPQLVVQLIGKKEDGTEDPIYLVTSGFNPDVDTAFAKIYQVSFAFDDSNLKDPQKCVQVTVDVVAWDVVPVEAEF